MTSRNSLQLLLLSILLFGYSCAGSKNLSTDTESNAEAVAEAPIEEIAEPSLEGWHTYSANDSDYFGIDLNKAYLELLADKNPSKKVIVAIIDSGIDRFHEDLSDVMWLNTDEIPLNGIDDDENGYVDDIYGWNFIGGKDSTHVANDSYELTRIYFDLDDRFRDANPDSIAEADKEDFDYYQVVKKDHDKRTVELQGQYDQLTQVVAAVSFAKNMLEISSLEEGADLDLEPKDEDPESIKNAKQIVKFFTEQGISDEIIDYEYGVIESQYKSLDPANDTRYIVGDDYNDLEVINYGNNDVVGPFARHGTHVAGIVAATRNNEIGMDGVADFVEIMVLRTVPNGDERDKDVANAIRYATNNGASVINMSFGKSFSPQKSYVDEAIKYADSKGVLMVHGAGNDAKNIDIKKNYPNKFYGDSSGVAANWITVGASSYQKELNTAADFSNYGKNNVDVFAPGVSIYSTTPENTYELLNGTSMAAPVVSGLAALIMSYYPDLSASQVKEIIIESTVKPDIEVLKPGSEIEYIPFSDLSNTGGIVNAYKALLKAEEMANQQ